MTEQIKACQQVQYTGDYKFFDGKNPNPYHYQNYLISRNECAYGETEIDALKNLHAMINNNMKGFSPLSGSIFKPHSYTTVGEPSVNEHKPWYVSALNFIVGIYENGAGLDYRRN